MSEDCFVVKFRFVGKDGFVAETVFVGKDRFVDEDERSIRR